MDDIGKALQLLLYSIVYGSHLWLGRADIALRVGRVGGAGYQQLLVWIRVLGKICLRGVETYIHA